MNISPIADHSEMGATARYSLAPWRYLSYVEQLVFNLAIKVGICADPIYGQFKLIGKGADKLVFRARKARLCGRAKRVFYKPVTRLLGMLSRESVLRREVHVMKKIQERAKDSSHLAVEAEEIQDPKNQLGGYTVAVPEAKRDYEESIRDRTQTFTTRTTRLCGFLTGVAQLASAGYCHGDLKPENALEDEGGIVRISDFGKAVPVREDEQVAHYGNLRFVAPEASSGLKQDVYSSLLVMIRSLEEEVLDESGSPLVEVRYENRDWDALPERRGFERYVVEDKRFLGLDTKTLTQRVYRRLPRQVSMTHRNPEQLKAQREALLGYVDVLFERLAIKRPKYEQAFVNLKQLMVEMASTNPAERPSAAQVLERFPIFADKG